MAELELLMPSPGETGDDSYQLLLRLAVASLVERCWVERTTVTIERDMLVYDVRLLVRPPVVMTLSDV